MKATILQRAGYLVLAMALVVCIAAQSGVGEGKSLVQTQEAEPAFEGGLYILPRSECRGCILYAPHNGGEGVG